MRRRNTNKTKIVGSFCKGPGIYTSVRNSSSSITRSFAIDDDSNDDNHNGNETGWKTRTRIGKLRQIAKQQFAAI